MWFTEKQREISLKMCIRDRYDIPCCFLEPVAVTRENMDEVIIDGGVHSMDDVYLNVQN